MPNIPVMNNRLYDVLKRCVQIVLPAMATLYFTLGQIWGLPNGEEVVGTIAAITTFLGVTLGLSSISYNENRLDSSFGIIDATEVGDDGVSFVMEFTDDPTKMLQANEVTFKINQKGRIDGDIES